MVFWIITFICVGIVGGFCAGLFGIGGGVIMVPCLAVIFRWMGMPKESIMHMAIATSLAAVVFNAASSSITHWRRHNIEWRPAAWTMVGIIIGSVVGPQISKLLPSSFLAYIFGVLEMLIAIYIVFRRDKLITDPRVMQNRITPFVAGVLIAIISSILGIAGGSFLVPLFIAMHLGARKAIGTSAVCGLILTIFASASYLFSMPNHLDLPYSEGYVNLPAWISIACASVVAAPFGAMLTGAMPVTLLKRLFAALLFLVGLSMVIFN